MKPIRSVLLTGSLAGSLALSTLGASALSCSAPSDSLLTESEPVRSVASATQAVRLDNTTFKPEEHSFGFNNAFKHTTSFLSSGLCGGMAYAALDYYYAQLLVPKHFWRPAEGTPLQQYLWNRQWNSVFGGAADDWLEFNFNPGGARNDEFFSWTLDGRPGGRLRQVVEALEGGQPFVLGLKSKSDWFEGHQVVAFDIDLHGQTLADFNGSHRGPVSIFVYDPNYPNREMELVHDGVQSWIYANWLDVAAKDKSGNPSQPQTDYGYFLSFFVDTSYAPQTPPVAPPEIVYNDGLVHKILLQMHTGKDWLDGDKGVLSVSLNFRDGRVESFANINQGWSWVGDYTQSVPLQLSAGFDQKDLHSITITDSFEGGSGGDNYDLKSLHVFGLQDGGWHLLTGGTANYFGYPHEEDQLFRFKGDPDSLTVLTDNDSTRAPGWATGLLLEFQTGGDNLEGGSENVHATIHLKDGTSKTISNVNRGVNWANNSLHQAMVHLPDNIPMCKLDWMSVFMGNGDDWDMSSVRVDARGPQTNSLVGGHDFHRFVDSAREVNFPLNGADVLPPVVDYSGLSPVVDVDLCPNTRTTIHLGRPTATDECATPTVTGQLVANSVGSGPLPIPVGDDGTLEVPYGLNVVVWTVGDGTNTVSLPPQTVNAFDRTPPQFDPHPASVTIETCEDFTDITLQAPTWTDACDTTVVGELYWGTLPLLTFVPGDTLHHRFQGSEYIIKWTVTDGTHTVSTEQNLTIGPRPDGVCLVPPTRLQVEDGERVGGLNRPWGMIMDSSDDSVCWDDVNLSGRTFATLRYSNGEGGEDAVDITFNGTTIGNIKTPYCTTNGAWSGDCANASTQMTPRSGTGRLCLVGLGTNWIAALDWLEVAAELPPDPVTLQVESGTRSGGLDRNWGMIFDSAGDSVCWSGQDLAGVTHASLRYSNGEGNGDSVNVVLNGVTIANIPTPHCATNGAWSGNCNTVTAPLNYRSGTGTLCLVGAGPGWVAAVDWARLEYTR